MTETLITAQVRLETRIVEMRRRVSEDTGELSSSLIFMMILVVAALAASGTVRTAITGLAGRIADQINSTQ